MWDPLTILDYMTDEENPFMQNNKSINKTQIMTPKQLKKATDKELIIAYKNKARCYHSERKAEAIYKELENRMGSEKLYGIRLEAWHMQHGEGDAMFNDECDKLLNGL